MNIPLPYCTASFSCDYSTQEVMQKISETVKCMQNTLKILKVFNDGTQNMVLCACFDGNLLGYNSFLPIVKLQIEAIEYRSKISISFELRKITKVILSVYSAFLLFGEVCLLVETAMNRIGLTLLLLSPLAMVAFCLVLSTLGLYFSSKKVLKILYSALTCRNIKCLPPIRYRLFRTRDNTCR